MYKWTSVKECQPEKSNCDYLIALNIAGQKSVVQAAYDKPGGWGKYSNCITHWMPLPKLPQDGGA